MNVRARLPDAAEVAREVRADEFARLLGLPRNGSDAPEDPRLVALAEETRAWYARHGRPYTTLARVAICSVENTYVRVRNTQNLVEKRFNSRPLASQVRRAGTEFLVAAAISAGPELELEAERHWSGRPDKAWYLERFGAAIVEHLLARLRSRCAERWGVELLPTNAPGYVGWPLTDQAALFALLTSDDESALGPIRMTEAGMLSPKNSILTVFGLAAASSDSADDERVPCHTCAYDPCAYRRS